MKILITGGAGFIGVNTASYFLAKKDNVTIFDNLSRQGSEKNISFLKKNYPKTEFVKGDIRDFSLLRKSVEKADVVFHFAGQVAVTTSVLNPREDFESNALGSLNVLEAIRLSKAKPVLFYSSSNKVYGGLEHVPVVEKKTRYAFKDLPQGVDETMNLDFHSPYGCSKGIADQYTRDYARIYGLKTVVFRQSCIFGPHQFGIEDQGWIAWFLIALLKGKKITIYGNGKQVRDLLFIDDLVKAYDMALKNIKKTSGQIYNIGGGVKNSTSVWVELRPLFEKLLNRKINVPFAKWRPGDQYIFIADSKKAKRDFGWEPTVGIDEGVTRLHNWIKENAL